VVYVIQVSWQLASRIRTELSSVLSNPGVTKTSKAERLLDLNICVNIYVFFVLISMGKLIILLQNFAVWKRKAKAVPCCLSWLVARVLPRRAGCNSRPFREGFVVDRMALGQDLLQVLPSFPCQYHSTSNAFSVFIHLSQMLYNLRNLKRNMWVDKCAQSRPHNGA